MFASARHRGTDNGIRYAAVGFVVGLAWGLAAREELRGLSAHPHASWRSTMGIVVSAAVVGALLGSVHAARRRGATGRWRALALPAAAVLLSLGVMLLPAFLVGGWALRRGRLGRRLAAASLVVAPLLLAQERWGEAAGPLTGAGHPTALGAAGLLLGAVALALGAAWGGSVALGPWSSRAPRPRHAYAPSPQQATVPTTVLASSELAQAA
jgi:hypothetical protein